MPTIKKRWPVHVLVIVAYLGLALALTWPLAAHLGTHVPGDGADDPPLTWNLWWVQHALLTAKANPFDCDYLFYPLGINLAFYTLTVLNGLLSIPLQATAGLIPASNILLLSSFVLSGYGTFLLVSYLLEQRTKGAREQGRKESSPRFTPHVVGDTQYAAFLAGLVYAFASSKLFYAALGQWNIASSQWIPFYVLCLFRMEDHPRRWRYPVLAALLLLFQAYAELTYATFLVLFTVLWAAWPRKARAGLLHSPLTVIASETKQSPSGESEIASVASLLRNDDFAAARKARGYLVLRPLAVTGLLFGLGLAPILAMMIPDLQAEGDILMAGGGFADVFSADLLGFLIPTRLHPLLGSLVEHFSFDHTVGQHLYLGYSVLVLAVVGVVWGWRRRLVKFWLGSALAFWLLTLGPTLRINGHDTGLPLPFTLLAQLPFFKGNRYPSRYSVMLVLSLAVLAGWGLVAIMEWIRKKPRAIPARLAPLLLAALFLFEHLSIPLPLSDMRVPPIYQSIAAMPGDWTLLDLPVAWRNGSRVTGTLDRIIMFEQYYQTVHGKHLLAGNTSRNPPLKFQYFTEAPVLNTLIALETDHPVDPAQIEQDRALAPDVLRFFDIHAIVVHPEQAGPDMAPYVEAALPVRRLDAQQGPGNGDQAPIAYTVDLPPWPDAWTVEPGDQLGRLSYAEGWGATATDVAWAQRTAVRLLVPADGTSQRLAFRAYVPGDGQQLRVEVNGRMAEPIEMQAGWSDYTVTLPTNAMRQGLNEVWLHFEQLYPARQVQLSSRSIGQTGVESPVNLVVQSAGEEVGDFGHIYVNGQDVSPNGRGYNVAVVHPHSGAVERTATFDTHLDPQASQALASFLAGVPEGYLVAVAAADEASRLLGQEAVDALQRIGAARDLRGQFRWGHAIIGVKGAPPGAAAEALDWMRPVTLVVGEGATQPHLAVAFGPITFGMVHPTLLCCGDCPGR